MNEESKNSCEYDGHRKAPGNGANGIDFPIVENKIVPEGYPYRTSMARVEEPYPEHQRFQVMAV